MKRLKFYSFKPVIDAEGQKTIYHDGCVYNLPDDLAEDMMKGKPPVAWPDGEEPPPEWPAPEPFVDEEPPLDKVDVDSFDLVEDPEPLEME